MNMISALILLLAAIGGPAAAPDGSFAAGRKLYHAGEYRKAAAQFEAALKIKGNDPAIWYWSGMSYEKLADLAVPLDRKYRSRARRSLSRAVELAPSDPEYRRELFHFLLEPGGSLRQAASILHTVDESDPELPLMRREFERARGANSSAEARLGDAFLAAPRAAWIIHP